MLMQKPMPYCIFGDWMNDKGWQQCIILVNFFFYIYCISK